MNNDYHNSKKRQNPDGAGKNSRTEKSVTDGHKIDSEDTIEIASPGGALSASFVPEDIPSAKPPDPDSKSAHAQMKRPENQSTANPSSDSGVKRLSSQQVENIASRFSASHEVVSESDREQYLKSLGHDGKQSDTASAELPGADSNQAKSTKATGNVTPLPARPSVKTTPSAVKPSKSAPSPALSATTTSGVAAPQSKGPARGIAHFSGRTITLGAAERMTAGDEITVHGNRYQLKPGGANSHILGYAIAGALIVAAAFGGKYFLADGGTVGGSISGVALNQQHAPYQEGAVVRIPELGKSTVTNAEGLFQFSDIPNGTYKLEYNLAGSMGGSQTVSIADNSAVMVTLDGATKRLAQTVRQTRKQAPPPEPRTAKKATKRPASQRKASMSKGALAVTSDVSGAVVYIDNQKLGKVNHTFRRMNTGKRTLRIEKSGYETYEGSITIKPGKIAKANVTLVRLAVKQKPTAPVELSASDLFEQGRESFNSGEYQDAVTIFNESLKKNPGLADAYFFRAEALTKSGNSQDAYLDYIRAGEIWSRQKRTQDALSAFDNAIEVSNGAAVAYKVRGDFYLNSKNRSKGIEDYKKALKKDKKYYDAHLALGIAYFEVGSYRKADKQLRRAQDFNDHDATLYHYLMLNSLAKNDLGDVNSYYKQFKKKASPAELSRFNSDNKLAAVRRVVKD